jgi:hypothetical protein
MSNSLPRHRVLRLSLRELLVLMALFAVLLPSLKYASDSWLALVAAITMAAFVLAMIVAIVDRGPRQAFAIGFALTMAAYGLIVTNLPTQEFDQWEGRLPTTRVLRYVHSAVERSEWTQAVPVLQRGAVEPMVEVLQRMLNIRLKPSPNLELDADFGPLTDRAVKLFQTQNGLDATGVVDTDTWKALGLVFDAQSRRIIIPARALNGRTVVSLRGGGLAVGGTGSFREIPPREIFMPIGHCWWAVLLGYAGGFVARFVYWRRMQDEQSLAT